MFLFGGDVHVHLDLCRRKITMLALRWFCICSRTLVCESKERNFQFHMCGFDCRSEGLQSPEGEVLM